MKPSDALIALQLEHRRLKETDGHEPSILWLEVLERGTVAAYRKARKFGGDKQEFVAYGYIQGMADMLDLMTHVETTEGKTQ